MLVDGEPIEPAFVCNIDETDQDPDEPKIEKIVGSILSKDESLARATINVREIVATAFYPVTVRHDLGKLLSFLAYSCEVPSRRKRTPVDVDAMVKAWAPLVKQLACAHDVDEKDAASAALDDLLMPILGAPISQIRTFYRALTAELKADKSVPWAVWRLFDFWGENVLDKIEKEELIGLKTEVAKRIAERAEAMVPREDWINSMVGALQWRSPEKLEQIEQKMKEGHKPRVKGRESCLFLQVDEVEVML